MHGMACVLDFVYLRLVSLPPWRILLWGMLLHTVEKRKGGGRLFHVKMQRVLHDAMACNGYAKREPRL